MARYELTDSEWEQIAPHLPPTHTGKRGHPWSDHRPVLNGIFWILRSGAPWQDLPERYPPPSTCHDRLTRGQQDGTWQRILQAIQAKQDQDGTLIWAENALDATIVRAHQHAAGARRLKKRASSGRTRLSPVRFRSRRRPKRGSGTQPRRADEQNPSSGGWQRTSAVCASDSRSSA
jgi:transposase